MPKKGLSAATLIITGLIIHAASSKKTLIEGAGALLTTPLGEMIRDGSILSNMLSAIILIAVVGAGLRLAPLIAPLLRHEAMKKLDIDPNRKARGLHPSGWR